MKNIKAKGALSLDELAQGGRENQVFYVRVEENGSTANLQLNEGDALVISIDLKPLKFDTVLCRENGELKFKRFAEISTIKRKLGFAGSLEIIGVVTHQLKTLRGDK